MVLSDALWDQNLIMDCTVCGQSSPDGFRFCGYCGGELTRIPVAPVAGDRDEDLSTERRRLTVMFCDLMDSTYFASDMDPEDTHLILQQYHNLCDRLVSQRGGYIAQHLGDGVLAYFGFPQAHEDDAARAIAAGLQIAAELPHLRPAAALPAGASLAVRIGIHSGEVVTADIGRGAQSERLALGEVPNLAARLQGLAERNSVVVSAASYALAAAAFEFVPRGLHAVKGLSKPIEVYRALRRTSLRENFHAGPVNDMVGRTVELARLEALFNEACAGHTRSIAVVGEPGIGKTRLIRAFEPRLASTPHAWLFCRCSSDGGTTFLQPLVEMLSEWCGISAGLDAAQQHAALRRNLRTLFDVADAGIQAALARLLNLPPTDATPLLAGRPEDQKEQIFGALIAWLGAHCHTRPMVLLIEDMHWADPSTVELLERMRHAFDDARVLFVMVLRPQSEAFASLQRQGIEILTLAPLSVAQTLRLISDCAQDISDQQVQAVLSRADGVPLFVQELARLVVGGAAIEPSSAPLPDRVRDLFTARLDSLGESKRIASMAAVIGFEFSADLLSLVAGSDATPLHLHLDTLMREGIVFQRGPDESYVFKHALIRDAALANLLKRNLRNYNHRVATSLEDNYPDECNARPDRLARHWGQANQLARALPYFAAAADRARAVYANSEAINLYREAIEVSRRPALGSSAPVTVELLYRVQEGLADVLTLVRRHGDAVTTLNTLLVDVEGRDHIRRARLHRKAGMASRDSEPHGIPRMLAALEELGEAPTGAIDPHDWWAEWLQVKFELSKTYYQLVRVPEMMLVAREIEPLLREYGTPYQEAELANQLLLIDRRLQRFAPTPECLKYSTDFVLAAQRSKDLPLHAAACTALAMVLMDHGQFGAAEKEFVHALDLCERSGHRSAEIRALVYFAVLSRRQGNVARCVCLSEKGRALALSAKMQVYVGSCDGNLSWAAFKRGESALALELGESALAGLQAASARSPFFWIALLPLAAIHAACGDWRRCVDCLAQMLDKDQQLLSEELMIAITAAVTARAMSANTLQSRCSAALRLADLYRYL